MDCITGPSSSSSKPTYNNKRKENNNNNNNKSVGKKISKGVKLSTDPQSVAARERRHRISDRFKILQSMVPGGGKMDTVSMLEEAIHYVKFLKAQIWIHQNMMTDFVADDVSVDESSLVNSYDSPTLAVPDRRCYFPNYEQNNVVAPIQQNTTSSVENLCSVFQGEGTTIGDDAVLNHWPA